MRKVNWKICISVFTCIFFFGCTKALQRLFVPQTEPKHEITIHKIVQYPRAKKIEKKIRAWNGQEIYVNVNYYTHSSVVRKIELVPRKSEDYFDLKLFLNKKGRLHWMSVSHEFKNEPLAFVINGVFYRSFLPKPLVGDYDADDDTPYIVIEGPFDKVTAEKIAEWAPKNYNYYNIKDD